MTKAELIEEVSRVVEMTRKDSEVIVEAIFDSIVKSLRSGDKIEIRGFGSFRTRQRQPRVGRNPKTGTRVEVPSKRIPYFKPSKELKDLVNNSAGGEAPAAAAPASTEPPAGAATPTARNPHFRFMDHLWSPWRYQYVQKEKTSAGCVFCRAATAEQDEENLVVHRGRKNFLILNLYPYSTGHLMVVPYEHVDMLQYASEETLQEMMLLTQRTQIHLQEIYRPPGFNLGMNLGASAGAGIAEHIHMHVLPRWPGDTNFMTTIAETRVLPEDLTITWRKLHDAFAKSD